MVDSLAAGDFPKSSLNRFPGNAIPVFSIVFILFSCFNLNLQAQVKSIQNGNWHDSNTWESNNIPQPGDAVDINHIVTIVPGSKAEVGEIIISPTGKLVVEGTLIAGNNLTMNFSGNNISELDIRDNSVVLVRGNVHLTNKVKLNLSSYFIVMGNLTKDGAASQGEIVIDDASIYVFGTISENTGLIVCDEYIGITHSTTGFCHAGDVTDFENNAADGTIPVDIVNLVEEEATKIFKVTAVMPAVTCNGGNGKINNSITEVATEVTFIVELITDDPAFNPEWEFSFTVHSSTGASIHRVAYGENILTAASGIYTLSGISCSSGTGSVTIDVEATGKMYTQEDVILTITSAKELTYNTYDTDTGTWIATQIIHPLPQTSEISTD